MASLSVGDITNERSRMLGGKSGFKGGKKIPRIAIIGSGLSGMTMALEIKKQLGIDTFTIYERTTQVAGTWSQNTRIWKRRLMIEVPSHWYSLSTELNPNWSMRYSPQPEIQKYWEGIHKKHNLAAYTQYDSSFESAEWDAKRNVYVIQFARTSNKKETFSVEADVLVSAIGGFSTPLDEPPSLKGLTNFKGVRFHSANWNHEADLSNKRIGVIGNGCSAAQFVPELAKDKSSHVLNFSRTPAWFFPRYDQHAYSSFAKWGFRNLPFVMELYRKWTAFAADITFLAWRMDLPFIRHYAEEVATWHILRTAPKKYHHFLVPNYPFGCKRIIRDPGYLASLGQDNVELITDGIDTITEKGIRGRSGKEYEFDVLVLGTGFDLSPRGLGINVKGTNNKTLTKQWEDDRGPQAYLGTTVRGFPNFYLLLGPNVATGHASVIHSTESQIHYVIEMLKAQINYGVAAFELKSDAEDRYNTWLVKQLKKTVWAGSCNSYYKISHEDGTEKVIATYPDAWSTRNPVWSHYRQVGGKTSVALAKDFKRVFKTVLFLVAAFYVRKLGWKRIRNELITQGAQGYARLYQLLNRSS